MAKEYRASDGGVPVDDLIRGIQDREYAHLRWPNHVYSGVGMDKKYAGGKWMAPFFLTVGPLEIFVKEVEDLKSEDGDELYGRVDHKMQIIEICRELSCEQKFTTLVHELLHIIEQQAGQEIEEGVIDAIAFSAVRFMQDNVDFMKELIKYFDVDEDMR